MKIAFVSEHASPVAQVGGVDAGGQNVFVDQLARAVAHTARPGIPASRHPGIEITVFTRRASLGGADRIRIDRQVVVEFIPAGPPTEISKDELLPYVPEMAAYLARRWAEDPPDVVHAHFWMSGRAALLAARPLGIPVVQTFHALGTVKSRHQGELDTSPPERLGIEREVVQGCDALVALCADEVAELLRLDASLGRVRVIPCGVDVGAFTPEGPVAGRGGGGARILTLSRLIRRKGIENVVAALRELPGAELVVAGGPPEARLGEDAEVRRLRNVAREAGVSERVRFLGRVPREDVPALLRSADVFVCVPWYEPFGMTALEAMACGVPVVASAVGGFLDTVEDGVTGFLVSPSRPEMLPEALAKLLGDAELRESFGKAAVVRAQEYSWDRIAEKTMAVYRGLSAGGRSR
ncbi:glycosyltransferase [Actinomadura harenae]|uniref:Glycosyltransferase family 1 protein n=1 Tax=Actinomadura harenae TaxID=2483351 RepID=A0A3M2LQX9_9ACTN|nr:glycosyltransferase [Actinomadura harenae]RMI38953.1 glycosyltransferase family 1 protein [Actinomadura harenae]